MSDLIGLSGYAQTGKDTIAEYLVAEHGYTRIGFADGVREALYALNPIVDVEIAFGSQRTRSHLAGLVDAYGWDQVKQEPDVRVLLQRMGTEVGREMFGENVWVDLAMRKVEPGGRFVFTDVRFPNEAWEIKAAGGLMWRVVRPGTGPVNGHHSETAMDNYFCDRGIVNDGDVEALRKLVAGAL